MTDGPRSQSPDIELGTRRLGFVILRPSNYKLSTTDVWLFTATPQPTRRYAFDSISTNQPSSDPSPSFHLPSYSLDAALHHAKVQSTPGPSRLPSPLPPSAVPETDTSAAVTHPNIVEGNYGDPSDRLFSIYLAQADKFDKEQSESWKGDTEGILVFVCRRNILFLMPLTCFKYLRRVFSLLRWRRSSSRAISSCSRAQVTQSFSSSRRSPNNSLPSPMALPSPSHPACQARILNHQPRPSA